MEKFKNALKQASENGAIKLEVAMKIGSEADELLLESVELLKEVKPNFGMFIGGRISELVGKITNVRPKEQVYFNERESDGQ